MSGGKPIAIPVAARLLVTALAMSSLFAGGCLHEHDSLVIVGLTSQSDLPGPLQVRITVGDVTQSFDIATGLSATTPVKRGVYVDSKATGALAVQATTLTGTPCVVYTSMPAKTVTVPSAGSTVEVDVVLVSSGSCGSGDGGTPDSGLGGTTGGTGGRGVGGMTGTGGAPAVPPPSLSRCVEIRHTDVTCDTTQGIGFGAGNAEVFSVAFSPDGRLLVTAGDDGRIRFWTVPTGNATPTVDGRELSVSGQGYMAFSHDGRFLAAGGDDGTVTVWTLSAAPTIYQRFTGHTDSVAQVSFSRDDAYLVSAAADDQVIVWSMASRSSIATIPIAAHPWTVEVSPLSTATALPIALTLFDGSLVLMNARAPTPVPMITSLVSADATWRGEGLAYSPDGASLAVGSEDSSLSFWSGASSGLPVRTRPDFLPPNLNGSTYQAVKGVAFFPDGQHVAAATGTSGNGGQLGVWETSTRRQIGAKIPTYYLLSVAVSPDGAGVVAGEVECGLVLYCRD